MLEFYDITQNSKLTIPILFASISAGQPLELEGALERIDLNEFFSGNSESSLLLRVSGESMCDVPIFDGDWIMLDRLKQVETGSIVVARLGTGYTIKRFKKKETSGKPKLYLVPCNARFEAQELLDDENNEILGVVTWIFHPAC